MGSGMTHDRRGGTCTNGDHDWVLVSFRLFPRAGCQTRKRNHGFTPIVPAPRNRASERREEGTTDYADYTDWKRRRDERLFVTFVSFCSILEQKVTKGTKGTKGLTTSRSRPLSSVSSPFSPTNNPELRTFFLAIGWFFLCAPLRLCDLCVETG